MSFSQLEEYPIIHINFEPQENFISPSIFTNNQSLSLTTSYYGYTDVRKNVNGTFINLSHQFGKEKVKRNAISGMFLSENSGPFLQKSRIYGRYAHRIQASDDLYLGLGATLGMYNYTIENNIANISGSDWVPDGNIGIGVYYQNFQGSISINQFLNSEIVPIKAQYLLARYYSFSFNYFYDFSRFTLVYNNILLKQNELLYFHNLIQFEYLKKAYIQLNYNNQTAITWGFGIKNFGINAYNLDFGLFYNNVPLYSKQKASGRYQIRFSIYKNASGHLSPTKG